jgi:hypothetical protein
MMHHLPQLAPACRERTQLVWKLESELAAKNHMTVPEYITWGLNLHAQAAKTHDDYKIVNAPGTPQTQTKPPSPKQN